MSNLTDRWIGHLEAAAASNQADEQNLHYQYVFSKILPELNKEGFEVPGRRSYMQVLTKGLEPIPVQPSGTPGKAPMMCSYEYLLNLLWAPLIEYIEEACKGGTPEWTSTLQHNQEAILVEMAGIVASADEAMEMDLARVPPDDLVEAPEGGCVH